MPPSLERARSDVEAPGWVKMPGMDPGVRAETDDSEEPLPGGNMGGAVRIGDSVRRVAGAWTPTVQRFLDHLRSQGLDWVPDPLGLDEDGRDQLSYLPGTVPQDPFPDWVWHDEVLTTAGRLLSELHRAGTGFDLGNAVWQTPTHEPAEVVCHNDFAPYNMVFTGHQLTGVIDWDTASPGSRAWDLGYLAYRLVPFTDPTNPEGQNAPLAERARRLWLLSQAYGPEVPPPDIVAAAVARLHELAAFTDLRAEEGNPHLSSHVDLYRRDARWTAAHADELVRHPG